MKNFAVDAGFLVATEVADYLVTKGVPFREAHDISGHLVRVASGKGVELAAPGRMTNTRACSESVT